MLQFCSSVQKPSRISPGINGLCRVTNIMYRKHGIHVIYKAISHTLSWTRGAWCINKDKTRAGRCERVRGRDLTDHSGAPGNGLGIGRGSEVIYILNRYVYYITVYSSLPRARPLERTPQQLFFMNLDCHLVSW